MKRILLYIASLLVWAGPATAQVLVSDLTNAGSLFTDMANPETVITAPSGIGYQAKNGGIFNHFGPAIATLTVNGVYDAFSLTPGTPGVDNFKGLNGQQSTAVQIAGNTAPTFGILNLDNGANTVSITNTAGANVGGTVAFSNTITTTVRSNANTGGLRLLAGAVYTNTSLGNSQYVNGYVGKTGNTSFTYPVGAQSGAEYRPLSITAPATVTDNLAVAYIQGDAGTGLDPTGGAHALTSMDTTITGGVKLISVSPIGFWDWIPVAGTDNMTITVSVPDITGGFSSAAIVRLVGWNTVAGKWELLGSSAASGLTAGSTLSGSTNFQSGRNMSSYSAIGIGKINPAPFTISGTVFDDANGATDNLINGTGTNAGGTLFVNLVQGGVVVASVPVATDGTYTLSNLTAGSYAVVMTTSAVATGAALPAGWVNTAEGISPSGSDGTTDGQIAVTLSSGDVTGANFGTDQLPAAGTGSAVSQVNPGGTTQVAIPSSTFSGTDPDGTVDSIRITAFPANVTSITINGVTYISGTFPAGGVTTVAPGGVPTTPITVDPIDGAVTVDISYVTKDNAGKESSATGHASQPFNTVTISGTLYDDYNGVTNNLIDGVAGNFGSTVNAVLVNSNNVVVASTPVASNGSYSFSGVNGGSYTVLMSTTAGVPGNSAPAVTLPSGYVTTSEAIGPAFADGTNNSITPVTVTTGDVSGVNFGMEHPATADSKSYNVNPSGGPVSSVTIASTSGSGTYGNQVSMLGTASSGSTPGQLTGSDPDGNAGSALTLGSGTTSSLFTIDPSSYLGSDGSGTVPNSVMLLYNGIQLQPGGCQGSDVGNPQCSYFNSTTAQWEIPNYDETELTLLAKGTLIQVSFSYGWMDAANKQGAAMPYSIMFTTPLAIHLLGFDAVASGNQQATLSWSAMNEVMGDAYSIEHSNDGVTFIELDRKNAIAGGNNANYNYVDQNATAGNNYYRLHLIGIDGSSQYSIIRTVRFDANNNQQVLIYPNPVYHSSFTVSLQGMDGNSEVRVFDMSGRLVYRNIVSDKAEINTSGWSAGLYSVSVINGNNQFNERVRVQD